MVDAKRMRDAVMSMPHRCVTGSPEGRTCVRDWVTRSVPHRFIQVFYNMAHLHLAHLRLCARPTVTLGLNTARQGH
ncbi:hypothetical protein ACOMHN_022654 [Nucella lapillus]